jgi:IclR family KDG regulon transcriptional repressor
MSMNNDYVVKPVRKAIQVLLCLEDEHHGLSLAEISRRVGLPKTTVFKYLHTLQRSGLVSHDSQTEVYRLGLRVWELGRTVEQGLEVHRVALPLMRELRDRFDETVNLGILDDKEVVYAGMVESRRALRMNARLGGRDPAYSTSLGKAILAFLPGESWRGHVPRRLKPRTSRTCTSVDALRRDLALTRDRGFALDRGENEEGAYCAGAPIFDRRGLVTAAVSLSAPASRLGAELEKEAAEAVVRTAAEISKRLGHGSEASTVHVSP